jgi:hypothetical protein
MKEIGFAVVAIVAGTLTAWLIMLNPPERQKVFITLDPSQWDCTQPTTTIDAQGRTVCNQYTGKGIKP